jgi:DNA topoisomerase-2
MGDKLLIRGCFNKISTNLIEITELPVGTWSTPYSDWLEKQSWVAKKDDYSNEATIHFKIRTNMVLPENEEDIVKKFKLETSRPLDLVAFNTNNVITTYQTVDEMMKEWMPARHALYEKRRLHGIQHCEERIHFFDEKVQFIDGCIKKTICVERKTKPDLLTMLDTMGFVHGKILIEMPMYSMTIDTLTQLKQKVMEWTALKQEYERLSAKELWYKDLRELKTELTKN